MEFQSNVYLLNSYWLISPGAAVAMPAWPVDIVDYIPPDP